MYNNTYQKQIDEIKFSCPYIDKAISNAEDIVSNIEEVRSINEQLRDVCQYFASQLIERDSEIDNLNDIISELESNIKELS